MNHPQTLENVSFEPIVDMQFDGLHWIEASAGTGKTFTLSSLMVRIFLGPYLPNQVIATTFTRKAAAELKSRIRIRLVDTLKFFEKFQKSTEAEIQAHIQQEKDPLYKKVLSDYATQVDYARERLKLVIDQLDELFVGTLDSFSQKLLREFAFESGKIERAEITDDAKSYTLQLIHDVLREWIQSQPQNVVNYLLLQQKLKSVDNYVGVVENTLNFASAQFQQIEAPKINLDQFETAIDELLELDLSQVATLSEYYLPDGQYNSIVAKKWRTNDLMQKTLTIDLPEFFTALAERKSYALFAPHFENTVKYLTELSTKKVLNKCAEDVLENFNHHVVIRALKAFFEKVAELNISLDLLDAYLKFYLSKEVKKRLPQVLQQKGETTFAQQIRTLSEALQGVQGQRFAQFVQAKYPLILVDEFQDTNQDQDDMLARIWREPKRYMQGCMIMVGDPKQAIYGFRGGDMLTYNKARADVILKKGHLYSLKYNHRSIQELVEVVDALFQRQMDFGENVPYSLVEAGSRPHPALVDEKGQNHQPLRWLMLEDKNDEAIQVAWKIRDLLNQGIEKKLYVNDASPHYLIADDIAILSKNHDGLDKAQYELERLGIKVNRPSKRSVFDSQVAKDVGAFLTAIMYPYDEGKIKRALLSRLLNFNLQQLIALEQQPEGLTTFIYDFDLIREMWLEKGFLTAWQYALNLFRIWENLVATQSRENERAVVNLRHLTEVLSQHSEQYQGAQSLYHWYLKQLQSPSEREWELERKLSNEAGVQLMTIHQSKGLEFKIVFLLGADKDFREMGKTLNFSTVEQVNPQTGKTELQRVVAVNNELIVSEQDVNQHNARAEAEQHRLWYVALTRGSYRVYAMLQDQKGKSNTGLAFWRGQGADVFQHPFSVDEALLTERPPIRKASEAEPMALYAQQFPMQRFYPRTKTSFSALAQHLTRKQAIDALAVKTEKMESAEDEINLVPEIEMITTQPIAWIKRNFPMGTLAGNFLHEIFEHIDFQDSSEWHLEIHRRFKNDYPSLWLELSEKYHQEFIEGSEDQLIALLAEWLNDVLTTPLHQNFMLNQLSVENHLAEFPFYLSLSDHVLATKRIYQLFAEYGIEMLELNDANSARYLTGSIDLVYFDGQQYQIADYKSNFLGTDQSQYSTNEIKQSMSQTSYWLQAGLYLVALHRYLKVQLEGYDIHQHLGGASYLYLRGMNGEKSQGIHYWKPEAEFILRLDSILGSFSVDKLPEKV
ncbi:UvrD-helicase domain-containing protein [Acinetobacter portensis]|uniref:UvrD-helicase domain-containing protein n=1 Tax=Acinetobacter portensis TaxID=1839785 RepID=UPI0013D21D29|nr:UvrD-helicase domain-containing protein [Acinetobacter portensis]